MKRIKLVKDRSCENTPIILASVKWLTVYPTSPNWLDVKMENLSPCPV